MWTHVGLMWTHVGLMWIRGGAATSSPTSSATAKLSQIWLNLAVPQNALSFIKKTGRCRNYPNLAKYDSAPKTRSFASKIGRCHN